LAPNRPTRFRRYRHLPRWIVGPRLTNGGASETLQALQGRLARVERERDALAAANDRLRSGNIQFRAMDVAFRDLLSFADERSHGQLRLLIEETGEQLADWLGAAIEQQT
jgi:hypothetical protein